jgi:ABC-type amino acid transport system permease subunit
VPVSQWVAGIACLGLYTAAYIAEALRSGVFAVGKGQVDAALSLGLTYPRTMRKIILPQAFRTVIPALGSLIIAMIKNSAIVGASLVALPDLLKQTRDVASDTFQFDEVFFWGAVGYLLLTVAATIGFRYLEDRFAIRR